MRAFTCGLAAAVLLLVAKPAFAQFGAFSTPSSPKTTTTNMSGFLASTMARPNVMAPVIRPTFPTPLSLPALMPTLPNFQNLMLMRNIFGAPQVQVVPPPKKK